MGGAAFIAVKGRHTKVLWNIMEPSLYGAKALLSAIDWAGYKRLILKSDKEIAMLEKLVFEIAEKDETPDNLYI